MTSNKDITYPNALANTGKIVNVNDPEFQDRSLTFTCLGCGELMVAVHRVKGQSHFRHLNSNPNCNPQTYLHRLAKIELKKKFDSGQPFIVIYKSDVKCSFYDKCAFREAHNWDDCTKPGIYRLNLHTLYDTCQEEVKYNGFVADLFLSNSKNPEQKPLFLEVAVTHKCHEDKINSGIQIIELDIQEEADISKPIDERGNAQSGIKPAKFYNFDRKVPGDRIYPQHRLMASTVYANYQGLSIHRQEGTCSNILSYTMQRVIFEIIMAKEDADNFPQETIQKRTWADAAGNGFTPSMCQFCNKCWKQNQDSTAEKEFFCKYPEKNGTTKLINCPGFEFEPNSRDEIWKKFENVPVMYLSAKRKK